MNHTVVHAMRGMPRHILRIVSGMIMVSRRRMRRRTAHLRGLGGVAHVEDQGLARALVRPWMTGEVAALAC